MDTFTKYGTIILILLLPLSIWAQSGDLPKLSLRLEYEASALRGFDLNDFYRSYNEYHASFATQYFDTLKATELSHPAIGLGTRYVRGDDFGFSSGLFLTYGRRSVRREARFLTNIVTRADLLTQDLNLQLDLGFHLQGKFFLHGHIGGRFRKSILEVGYLYPDGSYSLGNEYDILGVYQANTHSLDLGVNAAFKIKKIYIPIGISWPMVSFTPDDMQWMQDFGIRQSRRSELPRDYEQWVHASANIDPATDLVRSESLQAIRLNIGIEYWFGD